MVASTNETTVLSSDVIESVWPPPSTAQAPTFEIRFNKAMRRSRSLFPIWVYCPTYRRHRLEFGEHGISGLRLKPNAAYLPWSDIRSVTLAHKRNQVCILTDYTAFGFKQELSYILSTDNQSFNQLRLILQHFAKGVVVEDEAIYWSYSKLMFWVSLFWLFELANLFRLLHRTHWAALWGPTVKLLNHLVSFNLT